MARSGPGDAASVDVKKHLGDPRIRRLHDAVMKRYAGVEIIAHGIDHIQRDLINAWVIGETEECRMNIVTAAVLLHDIAFLYDPRPENHHSVGAEKCREWLDEWSDSDKADIAECIYRHKGVTETWNTAPDTIEQKIVCDADLLEKVGFIGVVQGLRVFIEFGARFAPELNTLHGVTEVLTRMKSVQFYTRKGQELAAQRGGVSVRVDLMKKVLEEEAFYRDALRQLES